MCTLIVQQFNLQRVEALLSPLLIENVTDQFSNFLQFFTRLEATQDIFRRVSDGLAGSTCRVSVLYPCPASSRCRAGSSRAYLFSGKQIYISSA